MAREPVADCLFCKLVAGEVPAKIVYEDDDNLSFVDINPQAPTHVLVIPKQHYVDIVDLATEPDAALSLLRAIGTVADEVGLSEFRTVFNRGPQSGQTVYHVHAHLLGGRRMTWPPG